MGTTLNAKLPGFTIEESNLIQILNSKFGTEEKDIKTFIFDNLDSQTKKMIYDESFEIAKDKFGKDKRAFGEILAESIISISFEEFISLFQSNNLYCFKRNNLQNDPSMRGHDVEFVSSFIDEFGNAKHIRLDTKIIFCRKSENISKHPVHIQGNPYHLVNQCTKVGKQGTDYFLMFRIHTDFLKNKIYNDPIESFEHFEKRFKGNFIISSLIDKSLVLAKIPGSNQDSPYVSFSIKTSEIINHKKSFLFEPIGSHGVHGADMHQLIYQLNKNC